MDIWDCKWDCFLRVKERKKNWTLRYREYLRRNTMYLPTEWGGHTGKYLAWGCEL